jgi:fructuronate reductase
MVKLTDDLTLDKWTKADIKVPAYNPATVQRETLENPTWLHFGGGNLFRCTHAKMAQTLIEKGLSSTGIIVVDSYNENSINNLYKPYNNRNLTVVLDKDGNFDKEVIVTVVDAFSVNKDHAKNFEKLRQIAISESLQLVTYTITEKGYTVSNDDKEGPNSITTAMGVTAKLLLERFREGGNPLTLVSTDNFSHNGDKLKESVLEIASAWVSSGIAQNEFIDYINEKISFPLSVIDRITPNADQRISDYLNSIGFEDNKITPSGGATPYAAFVNTEKTTYLVIEDKFSNGRPELDKAGVIFTDKETVDAFEKMKVCTCLNPLHTALAITGCLLGYTKISDEMNDEDLVSLIKHIAYDESMKVVADPRIISPEKFLTECIEQRFANPYIPDTPQRIAADTSQKLPIRFGVTLKEYGEKYGSVSELKYIPFVFAAWLRYLQKVDDEGNSFEPTFDPMLEDLAKYNIGLGKTATLEVFEDLLRNENVFGVDLVEVGLAEKVLDYLNKMLAGTGAIRRTLKEII